MKKRLFALWFAFIIINGLSIMNYASADIPAGVKDHYIYNQSDSSIVIVKKRLLELGYFGKGATFSNVVSDALKDAVISFQRQNGMNTNGVIDREFLELLFSDDAVEKGGAPKTKNVIVTEAPRAETDTKKDVFATEKSSAETKTETVTIKPSEKKTKQSDIKYADSGLPILVIFFVVIFSIFMFGSIVQNKKQKGLIAIIQRYMRMRADPRCKKAINEAGIPLDILASGGEYFLIPLYRDGNKYNLRYDYNTVRKAEKKCGTSIISMLDGIAREGLAKEEVNRKLCAIWGSSTV